MGGNLKSLICFNKSIHETSRRANSSFFSLLHVCQAALRPFTLIPLPMNKFLASVVYKRADVRCRNVQRICQVPSHCPSKTLRLLLFSLLSKELEIIRRETRDFQLFSFRKLIIVMPACDIHFHKKESKKKLS